MIFYEGLRTQCTHNALWILIVRILMKMNVVSMGGWFLWVGGVGGPTLNNKNNFSSKIVKLNVNKNPRPKHTYTRALAKQWNQIELNEMNTEKLCRRASDTEKEEECVWRGRKSIKLKSFPIGVDLPRVIGTCPPLFSSLTISFFFQVLV